MSYISIIKICTSEQEPQIFLTINVMKVYEYFNFSHNLILKFKVEQFLITKLSGKLGFPMGILLNL